MMLTKTDGLVIRENTVGEQDRMITILTRDLGLIRAYANGSRSPKNKYVSSTSLLCYSDFAIVQNKNGFFSIREAQVKEVFFSIREDIVKLALAQYIAQVSEELAPREENCDEFLRVVLNTIYSISEGKKNKSQLKAAAELRLASLSGYMPNIVACENCGAFDTPKMYFSPFSGSLWCENCKPQERTVEVTSSVVAAMRHICFCEISKLFSFRLSDEALETLCAVCEKYIKSISTKHFATLDFYKSMTE